MTEASERPSAAVRILTSDTAVPISMLLVMGAFLWSGWSWAHSIEVKIDAQTDVHEMEAQAVQYELKAIRTKLDGMEKSMDDRWRRSDMRAWHSALHTLNPELKMPEKP